MTDGWTALMICSHIGFLVPPLIYLYFSRYNIIHYARPIVMSIGIFTISMAYHLCVDTSTKMCYGKTIDSMFVLDELVSLLVIAEFIVAKLNSKYKDLLSAIILYCLLLTVMLGSEYDMVGFSAVMVLFAVDFYIVYPYFGVHPFVVEALSVVEYILFTGALMFKYYQAANYSLWHPWWHIMSSLALVCNLIQWTYIHSASFCDELLRTKGIHKRAFIRQNSMLTHELYCCAK